MITLKTLSQATAQEVFDQVAKHLLTQNAKSVTFNEDYGKDFCMYRGDNGLKCAAGCLIGDDEYRNDMEDYLYSSLRESPEEHQELITRLQCIHDQREVKEWKSELKSLAEDTHLEWKFDKL